MLELRLSLFLALASAALAADNSTLVDRVGARFDATGEPASVAISYPRDYVKAQLGYAAMYGVQ